MQKNIWIAAKYLRLSIEDGDKAESESIVNQSILIDSYMKSTSDITIVDTFKDDGFSGTDFNRPGFQAMLKAIENKEINCIIVKDLSRFGREHIDVDRYIQKVFPQLGVRFIAINDNYDSETANITDTHLVLPVKSFVNDTYCRQNSQKVRSHLSAKRNIGEYVGNYVSYGYKKCDTDKSQIEIDPVAAKHVRDIFNWKMEGMSNQLIADKLNELGVLAPADYKRATGVNFKSSFQTHLTSRWSAVAIIRILKNPIYYGVLQQGKSQRINYKVKVQRALPKEEWVIFENHHEGIVTKEEYETVQMLLAKDTRIAPGETRLYLFGGLLSCGDCGGNLIRRTNSYKGEKTVFYICSSYNKKKDQCSRHSIREDVLIQLVMDSLKMYSKMTDAIRSAVEYLKENSLDTQTLIQHDDQILEVRNKVNKYYKLLHSLSGNLASGVISRDDYALLRERYQTEIKSLESNIEKQEEYMEDLLENKLLCEEWVNTFLEKSYLGISREYNEMLLTPPRLYARTGKLFLNCLQEAETHWCASTIKRIAENRHYLGNTYTHKTRTSLLTSEKNTILDKSEWNMHENTHAALISEEVFEKVQEIIQVKQKNAVPKKDLSQVVTHGKQDNKYIGIIFCGECGAKMTRRYSRKEKNGILYYHYYYICGNYATVSKDSYSCNRWKEEVIDELVYHAILKQLKAICNIKIQLERFNDDYYDVYGK